MDGIAIQTSAKMFNRTARTETGIWCERERERERERFCARKTKEGVSVKRVWVSLRCKLQSLLTVSKTVL